MESSKHSRNVNPTVTLPLSPRFWLQASPSVKLLSHPLCWLLLTALRGRTVCTLWTLDSTPLSTSFTIKITNLLPPSTPPQFKHQTGLADLKWLPLLSSVPQSYPCSASCSESIHQITGVPFQGPLHFLSPAQSWPTSAEEKGTLTYPYLRDQVWGPNRTQMKKSSSLLSNDLSFIMTLSLFGKEMYLVHLFHLSLNTHTHTYPRPLRTEIGTKMSAIRGDTATSAIMGGNIFVCPALC